ncbi:hypothetical protein FXO38_04742 [Capsicum annuum]|nr:hypothetical protein FXO37_25888 [Capsicum annuum]KAF3675457.1 hypothetical protein FXO38_04742 [Capsicum annuum]
MTMVEKENSVVYLYGGNKEYTIWYRLVVDDETATKNKEENQPIYPVALLSFAEYGYRGGWAVITGLEELSVTAFIAIVAGYDCNHEEHMADDNRKKSGEIYDLDEKTLSYLPSSDIEKFEDHYQPTIVVEDDVEQVFYSFEDGSMLIMDASVGSMVVEHGHPSKPNFSFDALWTRHGYLPQGFECCLSGQPLDTAVACTRPVFLNRTLYYFTYDLRLYGYDLDQHKWFRSESLHPQIYPLKPRRNLYSFVHTLLLPLPNRDLLALTQEGAAGCFTMASFSVNKDDTSLDVTVKHVQHFRTDYPFFHSLRW